MFELWTRVAISFGQDIIRVHYRHSRWHFFFSVLGFDGRGNCSILFLLYMFLSRKMWKIKAVHLPNNILKINVMFKGN